MTDFMTRFHYQEREVIRATVAAKNPQGTGTHSEEASGNIETAGKPTGAPTGFKTTATTVNSISFTWTEVTDPDLNGNAAITLYKIYKFDGTEYIFNTDSTSLTAA